MSKIGLLVVFSLLTLTLSGQSLLDRKKISFVKPPFKINFGDKSTTFIDLDGSSKPMTLNIRREILFSEQTPIQWSNDHHLPFFCEIEHRLEKKGKMGLKFRLGDVQYVDYLEGKRDKEY